MPDQPGSDQDRPAHDPFGRPSGGQPSSPLWGPTGDPPAAAPSSPSWPAASAAGFSILSAPEPAANRLASRGRRLAARLLDALMVGAPMLLLWCISIVPFVDDDGNTRSDAGAVLVWTLFIAVPVLFALYVVLTMRRPGAHNGQTWGKQILGIRVIRLDGAPITAGPAFLRDVLAIQVMSFVPVYSLADALTIFFTRRRETLHDLMASTLVVDVAPGAGPEIVLGGAGAVRPVVPGYGPPKPAGWYADPATPDGLRWWDGRAWTEHARGPLQ